MLTTRPRRKQLTSAIATSHARRTFVSLSLLVSASNVHSIETVGVCVKGFMSIRAVTCSSCSLQEKVVVLCGAVQQSMCCAARRW